MAKKVKRSPKARKVVPLHRGPQDLGLQSGEAITFEGKFPDRGGAITRLGDGGFRVTLEVGEEDSGPMTKMWALIQTAFEVHVQSPAGEAIAFMASFPTRGGAINRNGDGGCRLTWDISEDEMSPMVRLMPLIKTQLRVKIGPRLGAIPGKNSEADQSEVRAQD